MLEGIVYRILTGWKHATERNYFRYLSSSEDKWKVLLTQRRENGKYSMSLFFKIDSSHPQLEGEISSSEEEMLSILQEQTREGWTYLAGKEINSLEYFLPEKLLEDMIR